MSLGIVGGIFFELMESLQQNSDLDTIIITTS